jgi:hypothetical protein
MSAARVTAWAGVVGLVTAGLVVGGGVPACR